jgi:hypothetical protein
MTKPILTLASDSRIGSDRRALQPCGRLDRVTPLYQADGPQTRCANASPARFQGWQFNAGFSVMVSTP